MGLGLGIDAGGTATRWRLADANGSLRRARHGRSADRPSLLRRRRGARPAVSSRAWPGVVKTGRPLGIIAGITGLIRDTPAEGTMRAIFANVSKFPRTRVFVAEDMWIAYLSYFALGEGILVYSGTGSIGYYLSEAKDVIRVGGRGNLIDDGGSGFWIAREALKTVLRTEEESPGEGWTTTLGKTLAAALGGTDWNIVRSFVYGGTAARSARSPAPWARRRRRTIRRRFGFSKRPAENSRASRTVS